MGSVGHEQRASPLVRLWRYATGHRAQVIRASAWSIINKALDIAPPFLIGLAVDVVVNQENSFLAQFGIEDPRAQLVVLAVITFVVWALESLFEYLHGVEWRNLAQTIQHELRIDAYRHVQDLEIAYHEQQSTGELMAVLNDDVNQLERFLDNGANTMLQTATATILIGITFVVLIPGVAWLAFLPIPFIVYGSIRFQKRMETRYAAVRDQAGVLNSQLANSLSGIMTIKAFNAEERETARISQESLRYRYANQRAIRLSAAFSPLIRVAVLTGFISTLIFGGFLVLDGQLGVGQLLGAGVHHPAAAVAADRAGRNPRPLPAGDGVDDTHPQRARHRPGDAQRHGAALRRRWCGGVRAGLLLVPRPTRGDRRRRPSPSTLARPSPSSGRPERVRRR